MKRGALGEQHLGEAAGAGARFQDELALEDAELAVEAAFEAILADRQAAVRIELRSGKAIPLRAEVAGIVLVRNKAWNVVDDRPGFDAIGQPIVVATELSAVSGASKDAETGNGAAPEMDLASGAGDRTGVAPAIFAAMAGRNSPDYC
ncbi:MAG: hypothetical protein ABR588_03685 [Sphingomicrobium sp.]|nr:hypothetical protein [Sphingomonadales bacterium]